MSWLPKRDRLDPVQALAVDFAVAQEGNFSVKGVAALRLRLFARARPCNWNAAAGNCYNITTTNERMATMKKLIAMGAVALAACAGAEEKSLWSTLFSAAEESDAAVAAAAKADAGIDKLAKQLSDLKAKMDEAKKSSDDSVDNLKKQYDELKAKLKAKLDEYKARQAKKSEEEKKKAEERKAKVEQIKKDGKSLVDSFKSLFD